MYIFINNYHLACWIVDSMIIVNNSCMYLLFNSYYCYSVIIYLILSLIFILVMRFIHEPLAQIPSATSIPRNDFNKLID